MSTLKIAVVIGSVRPNRFADHPANWILAKANDRPEIEAELLDVREYPMPLFNEVASPAWAPSQSEVAQRWQKKVAEFDAYIVIAAEYNRAPTGALKNALDYAYNEWNKKPVAFVGYGSVGGARAIEQLRTISVELQMAPIRTAVHIPWPTYVAVAQEGKSLDDFDFAVQGAKDLLDQLVWWAKALKTAREAG
ncbi:NADPH-dependent FMN reductase [Prosthecomicrobium pneumaticum]|uniref:NAD(P)H-dependent FMN reductase n=1 Tax=Prosthecomicrobium pneumaticum TaxID=81895 RepID=A0A7W9FLT8_9HYPH|nr:NAD(P)H-dependent oxidoreductase [Prosthecomicrobium pneumaticum]MBB5752981.1 NAD(P)H-dependent FMN reductase [Prosthecomicrobium pneumaticum]